MESPLKSFYVHLSADTPIFGFPAEDERGDELRERAANGLKAWKRMSNAARAAYKVPIRPGTSDIQGTRERERSAWKRCVQLVNKLEVSDCQDYVFVSLLLHKVFKFDTASKNKDQRLILGRLPEHIKVPEGSTKSVDPVPRAKEMNVRRLWLGNSWANWFILHHGPGIFWEQWQGAQPDDHVRKKLIAAWYSKNASQRDCETSSALRIEFAIRSRACRKHRILLDDGEKDEVVHAFRVKNALPATEYSVRHYDGTFYANDVEARVAGAGEGPLRWFGWQAGFEVVLLGTAANTYGEGILPAHGDQAYDSLADVPYYVKL